MKRLTYRETILIFIIVVLVSIGGYSYYDENFADKTEYLTILHTNDVHGRLEPIHYGNNKGLVGGIAPRATLIKRIEASNPNTVTVDAGDFAQGSLYFNIFSGTPDIKLMHLAGYDIATLGNHEFDKGLGVTKQILKNSKYPFVCANIRFTEDKELQEMVKPYLIKDYNGLKVAFVGLIAENLKTLVNKLNGVEVFDSVKIMREIVKKVNPKAGMIVVISHMGVNSDKQLARSVPEIDVIIGGHSHTLIKKPRLFNKNTDKTLVVQGGEFGVHLGRLDIAIKDKVIQGYYYDLIPVNSETLPDKAIQKELKILSKEIQKFKTEKVGELAVTIGEEGKNIRSELLKQGSLVTEAIKNRFPEVDLVLQNSGGVRLNRQIPPGTFTLADVLELYPFENTVIILDLKGEDLKSVLETSSRFYPRENGGFLQSLGLEYTVNTNNPHQILSNDGLKILKPGNRVSGIKINGKPLENERYYKIAINDYMYNGGNGYSQFRNAKNAIDTGVLVQDAIVDFLTDKSPVAVQIKDKIHFK